MKEEYDFSTAEQGKFYRPIFGRGGVMETAFPPENMDEYLTTRGFVLLGRVEEVLRWTKEAHT